MTGQPSSLRFCRAWARIYTRGLSSEIRERRNLELESDVWEQLHDDNSPREILGRTLRGMHADVWWRYRTLLEMRGARQRSHDMNTHAATGRWWQPVTLVLAGIMATMGLMGLVLGETSDGSLATRLWATLPQGIGGIVILFGLAMRPQRPVMGSRIVVAGAVLAGLHLAAIPIAALIIIGGFWSGNLAMSERTAPLRLEVTRASMGSGWWRWLVAALGLTAIGFAVLVVWENTGLVPDNCTERNPCWEDSAAWLAWTLSWTAAFVTAAVGVVLGILRYATRHHTRPA